MIAIFGFTIFIHFFFGAVPAAISGSSHQFG